MFVVKIIMNINNLKAYKNCTAYKGTFVIAQFTGIILPDFIQCSSPQFTFSLNLLLFQTLVNFCCFLVNFEKLDRRFFGFCFLSLYMIQFYKNNNLLNGIIQF